MAKFCTKCGQELVPGEKHVCAAKKDGEEKVKDATPSKTSSVTGEEIKSSFMNCLDFLKKLLVKPVEAVEDFVTEKKYLSGIIMVLLSAIAAGLYKIATLKAAYGASSSKGFNPSELVNLLYKSFGSEPEYLKEFATQFANSAVLYLLIAIIGYFLVTNVFKGKTTIKKMVSAVGASVAVLIIGFLLNTILVFIDAEVVGYIRTYIAAFADIISVLVLYKGVKSATDLDNNKLYIAVASMSVCATVVIDIINKIFD